MELLRDYHAMFWVFFFGFFFKDFQSDSVSVYRSYFSHVRDWGGKDWAKKEKRSRLSFFFHNCAYYNLGSERQNKSINCPS